MGTNSGGRSHRGANHSIELRGGWAWVQVFDAANLALEEGARDAALIAERLGELADDPGCVAAIVDVRMAPAMAGPKTRESLGALCRQWDDADKPIVFIVGLEPIKRVQLEGIAKKFAPRLGRVVNTDEEASAWVREATRPGRRPQVD